MKNILSVCLLAGLVWTACGGKKEQPAKEKTIATEKSLSDSNDFYTITAKYPVEALDKNNSMETFVTGIVEAKKTDWKIGGEIYNAEQQLYKEFPDRSKVKYELNISFDAYTAKSYGTGSYLFTTYEYTGGANGNITVATFNFSKEGKALSVEDVLSFEDNNDIKLSKILAEKAMKDTVIFNKEMLYEGLGISYLKADGITLDLEKCKCDGYFYGSNLQQFILKDEGITFAFDKYAIAPGAAGSTLITLDWETLKPFMNKAFQPVK